MSWNHRVMKHSENVDGKEYVYYQIHECFYMEDITQNYTSWTQDGITPQGENLEDLRWELTKMLEALDKPILDANTGKPLEQVQEKT